MARQELEALRGRMGGQGVTLQQWAELFTTDASLWASGAVSIDMAKQFLMQRISSFRVRFLLDQDLAPDSPCRVPPESWNAFVQRLTDCKSAQTFLAGCPPVYRLLGQSECHDP